MIEAHSKYNYVKVNFLTAPPVPIFYPATAFHFNFAISTEKASWGFTSLSFSGIIAIEYNFDFH